MLNSPVNEQQSNQKVGSRTAKPGVGRAEAHRRAMMTLINDTELSALRPSAILGTLRRGRRRRISAALNIAVELTRSVAP